MRLRRYKTIRVKSRSTKSEKWQQRSNDIGTKFSAYFERDKAVIMDNTI
jgi:hypothetical protein